MILIIVLVVFALLFLLLSFLKPADKLSPVQIAQKGDVEVLAQRLDSIFRDSIINRRSEPFFIRAITDFFKDYDSILARREIERFTAELVVMRQGVLALQDIAQIQQELTRRQEELKAELAEIAARIAMANEAEEKAKFNINLLKQLPGSPHDGPKLTGADPASLPAGEIPGGRVEEADAGKYRVSGPRPVSKHKV